MGKEVDLSSTVGEILTRVVGSRALIVVVRLRRAEGSEKWGSCVERERERSGGIRVLLYSGHDVRKSDITWLPQWPSLRARERAPS